MADVIPAVIRQIALNSLIGKVGQSQSMPAQKPGFFVFDPEWARLKRMYILKDNFFELYKESQQFAPEKLKTSIRQSYASFKKWMKPYRTWTDVAFGDFPDQLYRQTVIYNSLRDQLLPHLHRQKVVSKTIPGTTLAKTPPQNLGTMISDDKFWLGALALAFFFIWANRRER